MVGKNDSTFSSTLGNMVEKCATSRDVQMTSTTAVSFVPERMVGISQIHLLVAILGPVPYLQEPRYWLNTSASLSVSFQIQNPYPTSLVFRSDETHQG